jgi:hypothetical protein
MGVMHFCDRCHAQMMGPGQKMWDTYMEERELCGDCVTLFHQFLKKEPGQ